MLSCRLQSFVKPKSGRDARAAVATAMGNDYATVCGNGPAEQMI